MTGMIKQVVITKGISAVAIIHDDTIGIYSQISEHNSILTNKSIKLQLITEV